MGAVNCVHFTSIFSFLFVDGSKRRFWEVLRFGGNILGSFFFKRRCPLSKFLLLDAFIRFTFILYSLYVYSPLVSNLLDASWTNFDWRAAYKLLPSFLVTIMRKKKNIRMTDAPLRTQFFLIFLCPPSFFFRFGRLLENIRKLLISCQPSGRARRPAFPKRCARD